MAVYRVDSAIAPGDRQTARQIAAGSDRFFSLAIGVCFVFLLYCAASLVFPLLRLLLLLYRNSITGQLLSGM